MKILAIEFSSPQRSVGVVQTAARLPSSTLAREAAVLGPSQPAEPAGRGEAGSGTEDERQKSLISAVEVVETGGRAARAFEMVETALRQAQVEREQIACLALGIGPGSYTGIRAAIALGQGWQLARDVKLLAISSAECIAAEAQAAGITGPVAVVIDAQRGEFYCAGYELTGQSWRETQPLRLASLEEVKAQQAGGRMIVGPEVSRWVEGARTVFPRAAVLGRLALNRDDFIAGDKIEPIYLRETQFVKAQPPRVLPG